MIFSLAVPILAIPSHAQEFDVTAWLDRCVTEAPNVPAEQTAAGRPLRFEAYLCLQTARRACQFSANPVQCFEDYLAKLRQISEEIRRTLPDRVDGDDKDTQRINGQLADAREPTDWKEVCLRQIGNYGVDLLFYPPELRAPDTACEFMAAGSEFAVLSMAGRRLNTYQNTR